MDAPKVLIVEDEKPQRDIMKKWLEREGFECIEAEDGIEGLERFNEHNGSIKLIVLDIAMPHMNGLEFLNNVRSRSIKAPVVICTALKQDEMKDLDVFAIFEKPLKRQEFLEKVHKGFYFGNRMTTIMRKVNRLQTAVGAIHTAAAL